MERFPDRATQIRTTHAGLIHRVVQACHQPASVPELEQILQVSAQNGWTQLVSAIRQLLAGHRDETVLAGLDEEDRVIVEAILQGLQNPATLPCRGCRTPLPCPNPLPGLTRPPRRPVSPR
jgi:hypothetical protein